MKLQITMESENADFADYPDQDVAEYVSEILAEIAGKIRLGGAYEGLCRDSNGNRIGEWSFEV